MHVCVRAHSYRWVTCARAAHPALLPLAADAAHPLCNYRKPAPQVVRKLLPSHLPKNCISVIPFSTAFATFKKKKIPCYPHALLCFSVFVFLIDKAPPWCCPPFLDPLPSTAHSVPLCPLRHLKTASLPESQSLALRSLHLSLDAGFLGSRTTGSECPSGLRAPRCFLLPLRGHRAQASGHLFSSFTLEAAMPAGAPRRRVETLCHTWGRCCRHPVGQGQKGCHQHPTEHTTALTTGHQASAVSVR